MTRKALGGIIASVLGLVVACAAGAALLFGGGTSSACTMPLPSGSATISPPAGGWRPVGRFDPEQVGHAATITTVGAQLGVPIRGWIIAVATAIQESDLRNPPGGPDDSIGLFQQRPSQGWGTPQQLRDPAYASRKFYEKLLTVPDWQTMTLTDAAQAVQKSAYPDAYADDEPAATLLVSSVGSGIWRTIPEHLEQCLSNCPPILSSTPADLRSHRNVASRPDASTNALTPRLLKISEPSAARIARNGQRSTLGIARQFAEPTSSIAGLVDPSGAPLLDCAGAAGPWTQPVLAPVVSGFRTPQRPGHDGVDLGAARGTPIKAAAAGTVIVVRCNIVPASHGCDVDGSPQTPGCGWYVDIAHAAGVITRYCHMLAHPSVHEGQSVVVGQIIGLVGSSGHSSGPHLHFEVHLNNDRTTGGAVDPVGFMAEHCAPLGQPAAAAAPTPCQT